MGAQRDAHWAICAGDEPHSRGIVRRKLGFARQLHIVGGGHGEERGAGGIDARELLEVAEDQGWVDLSPRRGDDLLYARLSFESLFPSPLTRPDTMRKCPLLARSRDPRKAPFV